jgi:hypothetical protein
MCKKRKLEPIGQCLRNKSLFLFIFVLSFLVTLPISRGDDILGSSGVRPVTEPSKALAQYGEIIYQHKEKSPSQLYIIGMSHRDSLTRRNGDQTSRVQAEVYKVGEWLIRNRALELLLPEGYFAGKGGKTENKRLTVAPGQRTDGPAPIDLGALEEILSDNQSFINAEMLLWDSYPSLKIRQVEDLALYETARRKITELIEQKDSCDYLLLRSELDYLQERRTAAILQRIPEIVNDESRQGNIRDRKAILTIGLSHIRGMIKYFEENRITVYAPLSNSNHNEDYVSNLSLFKEGFGISVIIPRTLAGDQEILTLNRLEKVVAQARRRSGRLPSIVLP